jgi:hypothetical protein
MVFTVKPGFMPSHEGSLHWKIKEVIARVSLDAYTANNLLVSSARLIFQEIMLEQREVRMYGKKGLAQMDKDGNLEDGVRVKVN